MRKMLHCSAHASIVTGRGLDSTKRFSLTAEMSTGMSRCMCRRANPVAGWIAQRKHAPRCNRQAIGDSRMLT